MNWKVENHVISELKINDKNIINPWGVETADSSAFFSLEKDIGYLYKIEEEKYEMNKDKYKYKIINKMQEGKWEIEGLDILDDNIIKRNLKIKCLEDTFFMDFVMRYRVKKEYINYAIINDKKFYHQKKNKYNQYECQSVKLSGEKFDIIINLNSSIVPKNMRQVMYIRDAKDEWIIHIRQVPKIWDKEVIKLCNFWYNTQSISQKLSKIILKNNKLKEKLWYRNEKKPYKTKIMKFINPNAFPLTKLKKNEMMEFDSEFIVKSKDQNKISIIIPTYRRVDFLERLLKSIEKQTYKNFEVIIIDDCSPNENEYNELIEKYKKIFTEISFFRNSENKGAPYSRNLGIANSKYELLALVDDDDEWMPTKLEKQLKKINKEKIGLVYTWTLIKCNDKELGYYKDNEKEKTITNLLKENFIPSPSVLLKKKAIIEAGLFDENLSSCQDWDMWLRIMKKGYNIDVVKSVETIYHKHDKISIGTSRKARQGYIKFYRKHYIEIFKFLVREKKILGIIKLLKKVLW